MAKKDREYWLVRTTRALQDNIRRSGPVAGASYTLVGGILLLGGLGYFVDGWLKTAPWGLVIGLTLGIVVGFYEIVKAAGRR